MKRPLFLLSALGAALVLAGCASVSPDGLRGEVQSLAAPRLPAQAQLPGADASARA